MSMNRCFKASPVGLFALILALGASSPLALADEPKAGAQAKVEAQAELDPEEQKVTEQLETIERRWAGEPVPQPLDPKTLSGEEKKLHKRVQERWDALVAFDLKKVYGYATPSYRKTYDQKHLNGQYHNRIARTGAEVHEIKFVDEKKTEAKVKIKLKFQAFLPSMNKPMDGVSWETDTWVKVNGQWWYVEPR